MDVVARSAVEDKNLRRVTEVEIEVFFTGSPFMDELSTSLRKPLVVNLSPPLRNSKSIAGDDKPGLFRA